MKGDVLLSHKFRS